MKYHGKTNVFIPAFDEIGQKHWLNLTFTGTVDRRRIYRTVRRFLQVNYNVSASKQWIKAFCRISNQYDEAIKPDYTSEAEFNQFLEEFIQRVEYDETKDDTHSEGEGSNSETTAGSVLDLQDQPVAV